MSDSEDDKPLAGGGEAEAISPVKRRTSADSPIRSAKKTKAEPEAANDDSDDDKPLIKKKSAKKTTQKKQVNFQKKRSTKDDSSDDEPLVSTKKRKSSTKKGTGTAPVRKPKIEKEPEEVFRWWEAEPLPDGIKWKTLEHNGVLFPPEYVAMPKGVYLEYDGEPCPLELKAEEVAGFYGAMLRTDYAKNPVFNKNFFASFREVMTEKERAMITDLKKCNFTRFQAHFDDLSVKRKAMTREEKQAKKEKEAEIQVKYGFAVLDGHKQKLGNYRIEPPGLFRGRGDHPKMGILKTRVTPEMISLNMSDVSKAPPAPEGHKWKEVKSDNTVTWLASWTENVQGQNKYVMFNADSALKGQGDYKKYEIARGLKKCISKIRADYEKALKDPSMLERQKATSLYFIDKLALRAGGEKDTDEAADTVGCCNLRCEHVFAEEGDNVRFDFLGKDSIRYENTLKVEHQVWKNVKIFQKNKNGDDELFDRLDVSRLNKYLQSLMPGLSAKVFRTYNASITLQEQLLATPVDGTLEEKVLAYNRANREVAVLCNHQRAAPKNFEEQMGKMDEALKDIEKQLKEAKKNYKQAKADKDTTMKDKMKKKILTLETRLQKKEIAKTDREENKTISLGTSKLNYLDPRISIAWCLKFDVPFEKVYNATQRAKFRWAIDMTDKDFVF